MPKLPKASLYRRHLSSNEPVVFFTQALIVATVIFMLAYLIFCYSWGMQRRIVRVQNPVQAESGVVDESVIKKGIDESQFLTQPDGSIDKSKLENLFPTIK